MDPFKNAYEKVWSRSWSVFFLLGGVIVLCGIVQPGYGADGERLWITDAAVVEAAGTQTAVDGASDGAGGGFFVWSDGGIGAQRVDASGNPLWNPPGGIQVAASGSSPRVISWGSDLIVVWQQGNGIFVQKISSTGVPQWTAGGVQAATGGEYPILAPDGSGGAFVVWGEAMRIAHVNSSGILTAPGVDGISLGSNVRMGWYKDMTAIGPMSVIVVWADYAKNIVAQKVAAGLPWGATPTVISNDARDEGPVDVAFDGVDGALITWSGLQVTPTKNAQVRAQRISSGGSSLWGTNGVVIVDSAVVGGAPDDWVFYEVTSTIASDGWGGGIVAWNDWRNDAGTTGNDDVYAQRVNSGGSLLWTTNGVLLPPWIDGFTAPGSQRRARIVSGLAGGAVVTYMDSGGWSWDISATRLDGDGNKLWSEYVYSDSGYDQVNPVIVYDGSGSSPHGAIIAWEDNYVGNIFAQKIEISSAGVENDNCAEATVIGEGVYYGSTLEATNDGSSSCGQSNLSPDVWYSYTADCSGTLRVATCGSSFDTAFSVHQGCPGTADNEVGGGCNDDCHDGSFGCGGLQSCLVLAIHAWETYLIRVTGYGGAVGDYTLHVSMEAPMNDDCEEALPMAEESVVFSTCMATTDGPDEPGQCNIFSYTQIESDIWYRYYASCNGVATISLCGSEYDTKLAVYGGSCPAGSGMVLACNDDACGVQSEVTVPVSQGAEYLIRIGGYHGVQGRGILTVYINPADLNSDCRVDYEDYAYLPDWWLANGCAAPDWCGKADINHDYAVDLNDLAILAVHWLGHVLP
ncbi:MAG: hypothetical protein BWY71_01600 [Planctomycetes bacterium ADurb.Bin412]|nr:MAG: hypothetical protein BWY71_01600 [Planctomycetes bacterium ADurb.Bin412]